MNRVRALATVGLVTALGLAQAGPALAQQRDQIQYTTLTRQVTGGTPFPVRAIFQSQEEYNRFFRLPSIPSQPTAPICDFEGELLLLVHLGTQGSEGYSVRVTGVERIYATPTTPQTVTVKYRITKSATGSTIGGQSTTSGAANASSVIPTAIAPAELIKIRKLGRRDVPSAGVDLAVDQIRFFEEGGQERVGFNVIARTLTGSAFDQVTVDFAGTVKVRLGAGEAKETRVLLSELERLATTLQNSQLQSLPRTIPTQQAAGRKFFFNHFDSARNRTMVQGTQYYEGAYADRLRPLSQTFDLILGRLERRPVRVEGTVQAVDEVGAIKIQGPLGLSYYLRGPLAQKLAVLAGRPVILEAVAQLTSANEAEGVISKVISPQRSQLAGIPQAQGGRLVMVPAYPMPEIAIALQGPRAQELAGPEVGKMVMLDMWLIFNERGIPTEGFVESILAITLQHVVLRDRPDSVSLPNGELPMRTSVWVSARQGGATGVALVAGNGKSGWVPSELLRYVYQPKLPGLTDGIDTRNPDNSGDPALRARLEREAAARLDRGRNPNSTDTPR